MSFKKNTDPDNATIILAGATGDLGGRIARSLLHRGANVRAIVRPGSASEKLTALRREGVSIVEADFKSVSELSKACAGGACVVSALSGLQEVILEAQRVLLHAAIEAGVPRFIPSDFAIDFTKTPRGSNRNLDLRQEFHERLDKAPIAATSIFNGMFTHLLAGEAPLILFPLNRVIYWSDADQPLDFTTVENTAAFTAAAALDPSTPRHLRIAGDTVSARKLKEIASEVTGQEFRLFHVGGLRTLDNMIKVTRTIMPKSDAVFPPWQGMQYLRNMFSGNGKLEPLDNSRYPDIEWTPVRVVLAAR
ncbi:NmrA family protein [Pontibacter diazotrophicus]|uniref:NmrA family protein n=1 Tax=Pontibacter diazotrophicus TaxID=1400979 RepID=A0A3D8LA89_9BACT|nr:NmrA family NAD(P)-binding protein [Pontibacter diazotrophicus]RDV14244.1 NmrA family protein [Pontibacter diazotrophicus]